MVVSLLAFVGRRGNQSSFWGVTLGLKTCFDLFLLWRRRKTVTSHQQPSALSTPRLALRMHCTSFGGLKRVVNWDPAPIVWKIPTYNSKIKHHSFIEIYIYIIIYIYISYIYIIYIYIYHIYIIRL